MVSFRSGTYIDLEMKLATFSASALARGTMSSIDSASGFRV